MRQTKNKNQNKNKNKKSRKMRGGQTTTLTEENSVRNRYLIQLLHSIITDRNRVLKEVHEKNIMIIRNNAKKSGVNYPQEPKLTRMKYSISSDTLSPAYLRSKKEIEEQIKLFYKGNKLIPNKRFIKYTSKDYNDLLNLLNDSYNKYPINPNSFSNSLYKHTDYIDYLNDNTNISTSAIKTNNQYCSLVSEKIIGIDKNLQFKRLFEPNKTNVVLSKQQQQQNVQVPQNVPQNSSQNSSQNVPQNSSQNVPQNSSQNVPQNSSQNSSQNVPQNVPQNSSQKAQDGSYDQPLPVEYDETSGVVYDELKTEFLNNALKNMNIINGYNKYNKKYKVHNVAADGDCFYSVIIEAYKTIGIKKTVAELRKIVYDKYTKEFIKTTGYEESKASLADLEAKKKGLEKIYKDNSQESKSNYFYNIIDPFIIKWCGENGAGKDINYCKNKFIKEYKIIDGKILNKRFSARPSIETFKTDFNSSNQNYQKSKTADDKSKEEMNRQNDYINKIYNFVMADKNTLDAELRIINKDINDSKAIYIENPKELMGGRWAGDVEQGILKKEIPVEFILFKKNEDEENEVTINFRVEEGSILNYDMLYIMMYYTGVHYELISYSSTGDDKKHRSIFKMIDLPENIKKYRSNVIIN